MVAGPYPFRRSDSSTTCDRLRRCRNRLCCTTRAAGVLEHGRRAELRRLLNSCHLQAVSLLVTPGRGPSFNPAFPLVEGREVTVEQYKQAIDLASDLGATKVLYIAGWQIFGTTRQEAWSRTSDWLDRIAAYAGQKDITIVVEPTAATINLIETTDA
jgi:fructoselysine 3-epimerase